MLLVNMMTRWRAGTSVETESAESEKLLRGCGCGPTGGGWFIHGVAGSSSVELWLYVLLREK